MESYNYKIKFFLENLILNTKNQLISEFNQNKSKVYKK